MARLRSVIRRSIAMQWSGQAGRMALPRRGQCYAVL
jgi:hypothetical protein